MRAIVLVFLLLASCELPTGPEIPAEAVEMEALPVYARWWAEVAADAGLPASASRVRWFAVPGGEWWSERYGRNVVGIWVPDGRIYLARRWIGHEAVVKHEMLHEVLRGDGAHRHPLFRKYDAIR